MNKPTIGIRQADGSFYAIMEDSGTPRKRLVLSAARADQHSAKIELFRSTDGVIEDSTLVGTLDLMTDESLESQDIAFEISIDESAQLSATATLSDGTTSSIDVDLSEFRGDKRSDADILADDQFDSADIDTLDDAFADTSGDLSDQLPDLSGPDLAIPEDGDTLSLDLPESTPEESLDDLQTDELDADSFDLSLDEPDLSLDEPELSLDEPELTPDEAELTLDDPLAEDAESGFDMDDLDAGFSVPDLEEPAEKKAPAAAEAEDESWHDFSMDDMEPMEFLDTGDQISAPKAKAPAPAPAEEDDFSMDDSAPLDMDMEELGDVEELADMDSDGLDSMPDFGSEEPAAETDSSMDLSDGLDEDFLPPPELSDDKAYASSIKAEKKAKKPAKSAASRPPKAGKPAKPARPGPGGGVIDKTALVLSLVTLSLLVVALMVLLFLNMIRPPQTPVIQPEVMQWKNGSSVAENSSGASGPLDPVDLGAASGQPTLMASTVLEVPAALKGVSVTLRLEHGDTVADAARRFGAPDRVQGDTLSW